MSRRQLAAFVMCFFVPAITRAGDVVDLIPGDTFGYVVIHRLADTDAKLQALGQRMKLPIPPLASMAKTQTGIVEGVDETGSIAIAFLPAENGPAALLYVPTDDYAAFVQQLDPERTEDHITTGTLWDRAVIVGKKGGHAIVAWPSNRTLLRNVLSDKAVERGTAAAVKTVEGDRDLEVVLTPAGVKLLADLGQKGLREAKATMQEQLGEGNPALAGIEVYVHLLNALNSEVSSAAFGLKLEEGGSLRVNERVWVQPTGKIAPILRDVKPYCGDLLTGLPNMPYVMAFGGIIPRDSIKPMMDFSADMMKSMPELYGLTPEQIDEMISLSMKYLPDPRGMSFVLGAGRDDAPLYSEMLGAMHVPDAKAYITNYRKFWDELNPVIAEAEGSFFKDVKLENIKLDGVSVLKVCMPIPGFQGFEQPKQDELDDLMEKLYGPGGITVYLAAADEDTVLMGYTDTALLRKALKANTGETSHMSQDQNIASTLELLPEGGQAIGFWSPSGTMEFANRTIRLFSGHDTDFQLPTFPETPPVGWTMRATPSVMEFDTVLPAETIEAIGGFVEKVKQREDARPSPTTQTANSG